MAVALYRPPYPAIDAERVRYVGDYVAFVVAETLDQAMDASEADRGRLRSAAGDRCDRGCGEVQARRGCGTTARTTSPSSIASATRRRPTQPSPRAAHVIKHRFVINRVTAVSMEPRGCVAVYDKTEGTYTVHTAMQRAHAYKSELAQIARVPESKVRVIGGDIGGSFGMKSAVYNEVPLAMLAAKIIGRPVKWKSTRSEAFLSDAQARDNVTDAELALDKDLNFIGLRVKPICAIGAQLQTGMPNVTNNFNSLVGVYRFPASYVDGLVRVHQHPAGAALSRQRPSGGGLCDRAPDRHRGGRTRRRSGRHCAGAISSRPSALPYKTALLFTFDCGEFEKNMDMALELADFEGFAEAQGGGEEARQAARHRPVQLDRARRARPASKAREVRFDRAGTVTLFCRQREPRAGARDGVHPTGLRPARPRSEGCRPTSRPTPTRSSSARAPAARARRP